jgi:hypothetical protein
MVASLRSARSTRIDDIPKSRDITDAIPYSGM